jgi:hypothetical protein
LVQTDWDALHPQLTNRKRTAGSSSGKVVREWSIMRMIDGGAAAPTTANAVCVVLITYTDNTVEKLIYDGSVDAYPPGQRATVAG